MERNSNGSTQSSCGIKDGNSHTEDTLQIGNTSVVFKEYSSNDNTNISCAVHCS